MTVALDLDLAGLQAQANAFVEDLQRGMLDVVRGAAFDGAEHARTVGQFTDHSRKLRGSIRVLSHGRTGAGAEAKFGTDVPYARFVEAGTAPHEIRPKAGSGSKGPLRQGQSRRAADDVGTTRSALRWESGGEIHFARVVHHPGGRPFPFIGPGAIKAQAALYARAETLTAACIGRASR